MSLPPALVRLIEDRELLDPRTLTPLRISEDGRRLLSVEAGRWFPVRDGVPSLLDEDARPLDPEAGDPSA